MISAILGRATVKPPRRVRTPGTRLTPPGVAALSLLSVSNPWLKSATQVQCMVVVVRGGCSGTHYCLPSHLQQTAPGKREAPGHTRWPHKEEESLLTAALF